MEKGHSFDELPETYVILITENDVVEGNKPLYRIERINVTEGIEFNDEEHIIYVNSAYHGDDEIGKLMHDFMCCDPGDMYYDLMGRQGKVLQGKPEGSE